MRKGQEDFIVAAPAKEQQPGTSLESKGPSSHGNGETGAWVSTGEQEEQAAFSIASFQQLPRKHIKLISHAPAPSSPE